MLITHFTLHKFTTIFFAIINFKCISSDSRTSNFQNFLGKHAPGPPSKTRAFGAGDPAPQSKSYSAVH